MNNQIDNLIIGTFEHGKYIVEYGKFKNGDIFIKGSPAIRVKDLLKESWFLFSLWIKLKISQIYIK